MKRIIAFEGMPGAGKTTLISNILKDGFLKNVIFLPQLEINGYSGDDLMASKLYLNAEKEKNNKINKLLKKNDNILLDRTFITTSAYCYARSHTEGDSKQYTQLIEYFNKLKEKDYFVYPNIIINLDISISESILRRIDFAHIEKYHYWFDPIFLNHFKDFYLKNVNGFKSVKTINIDSTNMNEFDLLNKTKELLKSLDDNK